MAVDIFADFPTAPGPMEVDWFRAGSGLRHAADVTSFLFELIKEY